MKIFAAARKIKRRPHFAEIRGNEGVREIEVFLVKTEGPVDEAVFQYLLGFAQEEKRNRVRKQRVKQSADNMLIGEILARVAVKTRFGIGIREQEFARSAYGKPYLPRHPEVHLSISHSGNYVVCGVSDRPIGVDIQRIVRYDPDVAERVCSAEELKRLKSSPDKASEFTRLWAQKEAVLKQRGTGLADGGIKNCLDLYVPPAQRLGDYWLSASD